MPTRTTFAITVLCVITAVAALLSYGGEPRVAQGGTSGIIFTVNTTTDNDSGADPTCSLRESIKASNMDMAYKRLRWTK